ncbi:MAG: haloacid dehalogenase-like hydrolase [Lysobacterales bacterium]
MQSASDCTPMIHILDIDGTLIPSAEIDNTCYWQAVGRVFGVSDEPLALHGFRDVTDSGILQEWHRRQFGTDPAEGAVRAVREAFLSLTREAAAREPRAFGPVAGVERWLDQQAERGIAVALATGGWGHTARFKLEWSGLARYRLPLASSDDAVRRVDIMLAARERLPVGEGNGKASGDVTFIGDGVWDLWASQELGWDFIGLASGDRRRRLLEAGAQRVVPDFHRLVVDEPSG